MEPENLYERRIEAYAQARTEEERGDKKVRGRVRATEWAHRPLWHRKQLREQSARRRFRLQ